jgi:hypothetical protein
MIRLYTVHFPDIFWLLSVAYVLSVTSDVIIPLMGRSARKNITISRLDFTPAPASGLSSSSSSVLTSLVHMPATFTLVAIASLAPLLYLIPATVLFLDILL